MLCKLFSSSSKIILFELKNQLYSSTVVKRIYEPSFFSPQKKCNFLTLKNNDNKAKEFKKSIEKNQNFSTTPATTNDLGTQTKEIKEWWNQKPFEQGTKDEVQKFLQTFENGKYKAAASKFVRLNGKDLIKMTKENFLRRSPEIGDVLFNDIQAVKDPDFSLQELVEIWKNKLEVPSNDSHYLGYRTNLTVTDYFKTADTVVSLERHAQCLWNSYFQDLDDDARSHYPLTLWTGTGLGKTRFGKELPTLLQNWLIKQVLPNKTINPPQQVLINFTGGPFHEKNEDMFTDNELKWNDRSCAIGVRLAARVLFACPSKFLLAKIGANEKYYKKFKLDLVMPLIAAQFGSTSTNIVPFFIHIDEVQLALAREKDYFKSNVVPSSLVHAMVKELSHFRASTAGKKLGLCFFVLCTGTSSADFHEWLPSMFTSVEMYLSPLDLDAALKLADQWIFALNQNPSSQFKEERQRFLSNAYVRRIIQSLGVIPQALYIFSQAVIAHWHQIQYDLQLDQVPDTFEDTLKATQYPLKNYLGSRGLLEYFKVGDQLNEKAINQFLRCVLFQQRTAWNQKFEPLNVTVSDIARSGALYMVEIPVKNEKGEKLFLSFQSFLIPYFILGTEILKEKNISNQSLDYTFRLMKNLVRFPLAFNLGPNYFERATIVLLAVRSRIMQQTEKAKPSILFLSELLPGCQGNAKRLEVFVRPLEVWRDQHQWFNIKKNDKNEKSGDQPKTKNGRAKNNKKNDKNVVRTEVTAFLPFDSNEAQSQNEKSPIFNVPSNPYSHDHIFLTCKGTHLIDGRLCLETPDGNSILLVFQCRYSKTNNKDNKSMFQFVNEVKTLFNNDKKFSMVIPVYLTNRQISTKEKQLLQSIDSPYLWIDCDSIGKYGAFVKHLFLNEIPQSQIKNL